MWTFASFQFTNFPSIQILSLGSSSDNGWTAVDMYGNCDTFPHTQHAQHSQSQAIFNQLKQAMGMMPNLYATIGYSGNALSSYM